MLSYESYLNFHVFARGTEGTSVSGLELSEGSNLLSPVFGMMPKRDALEKAATDKQHLLTWEVLFRCCLQMVLQSKIKDLRGKGWETRHKVQDLSPRFATSVLIIARVNPKTGFWGSQHQVFQRVADDGEVGWFLAFLQWQMADNGSSDAKW